MDTKKAEIHACARSARFGIISAFPLPEGAEVTDRGRVPDIAESAAFDGLPQGICYPSKAAFVMPTEVTDHGKQRENADAGRYNKPREWRRACACRLCEDGMRGERRACGWRVRIRGERRHGVAVPGAGGRADCVGVDAERRCRMSKPKRERAVDSDALNGIFWPWGRFVPHWPWQRDRLAAALRDCRRRVAERETSADEAAQMYDQTRRLFLQEQRTGKADAGGARRVYVRACARLCGMSDAAFILQAIDDAVARTAATCPGGALPVTHREHCALVVAALTEALFGTRDAGTLAGLVEGGEQ